MSDDEDRGEIIATVHERDVLWHMDAWESAGKKYPAEDVFEESQALAALFAAEVVFANSFHWNKDWPDRARKAVSVNVICNDVFAWGCADAEGLPFSDIEPLYRMWRKDPCWGSAIWCMINRKEMPQRPVEKRIREAGIWDLDALKIEHGLLPNHYDGISDVIASKKRQAYTAWAEAKGLEVLPFDAGWWAGWRQFTEANPYWNSPEWKADEDRRCDEWRVANGWPARETGAA